MALRERPRWPQSSPLVSDFVVMDI